ncbi:NFACT family protein [Siminovitchia sediminis]|uniref:Rqc2 homolog RqcH n=1 Tax=Siminovitchia sediminis TaxID=1274353 RepID=A0ABW4KDF6_9BACI
MAFDGLFTRAMTKELKDQLLNGRINKIQQPFKNEILMTIRANGKNHKLLLSAHPSYSRVQLTQETYSSPEEPPMFCMMLRKHADRAIIQDIYQPGLDRMIIFQLKGRDELGDESIKLLIVEIMGRHSNIILADQKTEKIIDSIKHIPASVNSYRTVLPGSVYVYPPAQNKVNPLDADTNDILRNIDFNVGKMDKQIVQHFAGISPLFAKEILFHCGLANRNTLPPVFINMMQRLKNHQYQEAITASSGKTAFYLLPLDHMKGEVTTFQTLSDMLDSFYFGKAERDRVKQQAMDLEKLMKNEKEKNEKKIVKLEDTLKKAEKAEEYQLLGELLTANMHLAKKGMKRLSVVNYYDPDGKTIDIPLDPQKEPSENAQHYFSKYQKAKNSVQVVQDQIRKAKEEAQYFESLLQQLSAASVEDIEEIREELSEGGYIKRRPSRTRKKQLTKPAIEKYEASDKTELLVGKNNTQNEYLTNKLARRDEVWLHTKDIPGSHVVIRDTDPSEETILEAAMLAAYFSKARDSSSVPVDYTKIRHVKKPNGAKPGFVIYDHQQTVYVTPDGEKVRSMKVK